MADVLDRIREKQRLAENTDLAQAEHNADWSETFSNTPPADVLRDRVNLADTVNRVQRNRLALAAQSDRKALQLLDATARHEEWMRDAPLREQLLKSRIASQGAAQRFVERKDAETQKDLTDFHEYMDAAPAITDPGYKAYLNQGVSRFPRIIGTQVGADTLKRLMKEHVDVMGITPPPGYSADYTLDENGDVKANFKPITPAKPAPLTPEEKLANDVARARALGEVRKEFEPSADQRTKDTENAIVKGTLSFGHLNDKGKLQPDTGDQKATHVSSFYIDPHTGATKSTGPITIEEFKKFQARAEGKKEAPASGEIPTLTEKSQFDALPSGAQYYRNGKLFQKP